MFVNQDILEAEVGSKSLFNYCTLLHRTELLCLSNQQLQEPVVTPDLHREQGS